MKNQMTQITQDLQKMDTKTLTQDIKAQLEQGLKTSIGMLSANLFDAKMSSSIMKELSNKIGPDMSKAFYANFSDMLYSATEHIGRSF